MRIVAINSNGEINRVVTSQKGSWRWQDAYRIATYEAHTTRDGRLIFRSLGRGDKFAATKATAGYWNKYSTGSLHNTAIVRAGVDDFGNQYFIV